MHPPGATLPPEPPAAIRTDSVVPRPDKPGLIARPRLVLIGGILVASLAVVVLIHFLGFNRVFGFWNVPTLRAPLMDLQYLASSAESFRHGFDPAVYNPFDPRGRIFNYPPIWYPILRTGINDSWITPLAILMFAAFLAGVAAFPGRLSGLSTCLILLALLSCAAMLGFARANVEFIVFSLMALAFILTERFALAGFLVTAFAILLKIIPVLGIGGFIGRNRSTSIRLILGTIFFTVVYFVTTLPYMQFLFDTHEHGTFDAYGAAALPDLLHQIVEDHTIHASPLLLYKAVTRLEVLLGRFPMIPTLAGIALLVIFAWLGLRFRIRTKDANPRNLRAFWMGAGMYVGTFLIAANWDYRMIFLIFALPQMADWAAGPDRSTRILTIVSLVALFISMWYALVDLSMVRLLPYGFLAAGLITTVANWLLFAALAYLAVATLPAWLYENPPALLGELLGRKPAAGAVAETRTPGPPD